jgi:hypothetical protein
MKELNEFETMLVSGGWGESGIDPNAGMESWDTVGMPSGGGSLQNMQSFDSGGGGGEQVAGIASSVICYATGYNCSPYGVWIETPPSPTTVTIGIRG